MNGSITVARVFGIPIVVNLTWLLVLAFVTYMLATRFYPDVFPPGSPYHDDSLLHWGMALGSGLAFFTSLLLHELAHSLVARRQGLPVHSITLFLFGGVSQIGAEAKRPRNEFIMAVVGPLTSLAIGAIFFGLWALTGYRDDTPLAIAMQWLFLMNVFVAVFNMAPGFPMDGGRVLRSLIWGISGNLLKATRLATLSGRALGYLMLAIGGVAFFGLLDEYMDPLNGLWFVILGLFLESSAKNAWLQQRALSTLSAFRADQLMQQDLETVARDDQVRYVVHRGGPRFIYFVSDDDDAVVGVLTEKEVAALGADRGLVATAGDAMVAPLKAVTAAPADDGAALLQKMESSQVWHLPIISEGRVIGVVNKESLLRILGRTLAPRARLPQT